MKNWGLSKKIWSIIGGLAFAFIFSTAFGLNSLMHLRSGMNEVTGSVVKRDQLTSEIKINQRTLSIVAAESILLSSPEQLKNNQKAFDDVVAKQESDIKGYSDLASEKGKSILNPYIALYQKYLAEMKKVRELGIENKNEEATKIYSAARDAYIPDMRKLINELNDLTAAQLADKTEQANAEATRAIWFSSVISFISIILSLSVAFFVLRALTRAIADVVRGLSDSSTQVSSASTQIASASEQLSQATTEQAASLEETAASVEEMNSMVAKNSENANSAASTSSKSQEVVSHGKQVIQKMIDSMDAINKSSEGMAEVVKVIEQIDKKTKVINEIVNKTELLSFNASVEAARAGEHGKGFAVVAEEVGNLARMSGAAAEEIGSLLESSISKVNQMVAETKKNVDLGAQVTRECGDVFEEVVQNVASVSGMATEIASASQEQSRGCTEITKAMSQLDQMTQQNAATSEECASAAEELSQQAEALKGSVQQLVFTVNGRDGGAQTFEAHTTHAPQAVARKVTAEKTTAPQNVVHLKAPKAKVAAPTEAKLKKASGGAPHYDSDGFSDV